MKNVIKYWSLVLLIPVIFSCDYQFPETEVLTEENLGGIDVTKILAVGDGYLSGFMDGALYREGQKNSIASIVAQQINLAKETPFNQAEISSGNGYNFYASDKNNSYGKWIYRFLDENDDKPSRILTMGEELSDYDGEKESLNDLTVPFLKMKEAGMSGLQEHPYYNRIDPAAGNSDYFNVLKNSDATFAVVWLGMNDFLDYAINGAVADGNGYFEGISDRGLTSAEEFRLNFEQLISELLKDEQCKVVVGNLISICSLPYFYTQPYNGMFLDAEDMIRARARYSNYNQAVTVHNRNATETDQRPYIDFYDNGYKLHYQPLVVIDRSLPEAQYPDGTPLEKYRQLRKDELLLYAVSDEMIEAGTGSLYPLEETVYLTIEEIEEIESRREEFNSLINEVVASYSGKVVLADINAVAGKIAETGKTDAWDEPLSSEVIYYNGVPLGGNLGMNSIFSLDGLHFNQRGNAYIANTFIETINKEFGASIPLVDVNGYVGNVYTFPY